MLVGYTRVSTSDQNVALQEDALKAAGCNRLFHDAASGASADRPGLIAAMAFVREGDVLAVWRLDRLGRSLSDLLQLVRQFEAHGVGFRSISESIDSTTAGGRLVFQIFGAMAEFERNLVRERTQAGLSSARARGRHGGRPKALDEQKVALAIRPDEVPKTGFMVSFKRWNPSSAPVAEESSESENRPTGDHRFVMVVYGRRTDRSAEVVFPITNTPSVRKAIESLLDLYPQIKRDSKSVEILGEEVFWNAEFSFDSSFGIRAGGSRTSSPEEQRRKWQEQLLTLLPEKSTALLDGKTFREAAADPALRRRLEAVLMVMQEDFSNSFDVTEVFQRLRETLGLPAKEAINPKQVRLPDLSLAQFARLDFSVMPTQMLAWAMNVAASTANLPALRSLLGEVTRRVETTGEEILQTFPLAHLYLLLAQIEGDATAAQDHLENGLKYISDPIEAKVNWLVQGLETAISRRLGPPMMKLWEMLADLSDQNEYALNQYARICSLIGLDPPMRNPNAGPGGPRSQASSGGRAAAVAATVSQAVDTISEEPAVKPSKLWLPGEE